VCFRLSVELSLRTWLCGGSVVRQPCSRVAHAYRHMYADAIVGNGVMQGMVDKVRQLLRPLSFMPSSWSKPLFSPSGPSLSLSLFLP